MKRISAVLIALLAVGCTKVTNVVTPSGNQGYALSCGSRADRCYEKAGELCPKGYNVVNQGTGMSAVPGYGSSGQPGGTFATSIQSMLIECK